MKVHINFSRVEMLTVGTSGDTIVQSDTRRYSDTLDLTVREYGMMVGQNLPGNVCSYDVNYSNNELPVSAREQEMFEDGIDSVLEDRE